MSYHPSHELVCIICRSSYLVCCIISFMSLLVITAFMLIFLSKYQPLERLSVTGLSSHPFIFSFGSLYEMYWESTILCTEWNCMGQSLHCKNKLIVLIAEYSRQAEETVV